MNTGEGRRRRGAGDAPRAATAPALLPLLHQAGDV